MAIWYFGTKQALLVQWARGLFSKVMNTDHFRNLYGPPQRNLDQAHLPVSDFPSQGRQPGEENTIPVTGG